MGLSVAEHIPFHSSTLERMSQGASARLPDNLLASPISPDHTLLVRQAEAINAEAGLRVRNVRETLVDSVSLSLSHTGPVM